MTVGDGGATPVAGCTKAEAGALGGRVMAAAADMARQDAVFLDLVGEFDAADAVRHWSGLGSTAQWLAWSCSIAPGTAREHVRVARALRRMPATRTAFATAELTYSKVRELTRLVDRITSPDDEQRLVEFARYCTADQLARTVAGYRAATGTDRQRRRKQRVSYLTRPDGTVRFTADLPPEEGAAVIAALTAAYDANRTDQPQPGDLRPDDSEPDRSPTETQADAVQRTRVEALCEIAHHYLNSRPEDRSGEDRTEVVLEINASALEAGAATPLPSAGADDDSPVDARPADTAPSTDSSEPGSTGVTAADVPAGTSVPTCRVRNGGAVESSTARRALCDTTVVGMIINDLGEPLAVGRRIRLVTQAQRRALMIRDGQCQYPGCTRTRRLKAHHRVSWLAGGPTDLTNLILLCQWHHTRVHEDQITIIACDRATCPVPWRFVKPDGSTISPQVAGLNARSPWRPLEDSHGRALPEPTRTAARRRNDARVAAFEAEQKVLQDRAAAIRARYDHVDRSDHPDAQQVFPIGGGEGFRLAECVDVLFRHTITTAAGAA